MRCTTISAAVLFVAASSIACAQSPVAPASASKAAAKSASVATTTPSMSRDHEHGQASDGFTWGPAPAIFPKGAQMAVLQGDPGGTGLFTVRLRFPNNYRIPPHTHPTDESVTVISGTFIVGMGSTVSSTGTLTLHDGGFVIAPANHAHYASARGMTVVQVHAMGPFAMTYVNPADTPVASR